jgi:hypothetical protein
MTLGSWTPVQLPVLGSGSGHVLFAKLENGAARATRGKLAEVNVGSKLHYVEVFGSRPQFENHECE